MTNRISFSLLVVFILLALNSCKHNPVAPVVQPGPRDYLWTMDTLYSPMNSFQSVWGSSDSDVWAVGAGGTPFDYLQHFDGTRWAPWFANHPQVTYVSGECLYGFSSNDVWMGGQSWGDPGAGICHWNGVSWGSYFNYNPEPDTFSTVWVQDVWGFRPNNVYACGGMMYSLQLNPESPSSRGFLLHYDGSSWREVVRGDSGQQCGFIKLRGEDSTLFVQEYRRGGVGDSVVIAFYKWDQGHLSKIYSNVLGRMPSTVNFEYVGDEVCFPFSNDVYIYSQGEFVKYLSVNILNWNYYLCGRSKEDIFLSMSDGLVHYNGTDYKYLYEWPEASVTLCGRALFNKDVFFLLNHGYTNFVLHGTLKQ